MLNIRKMLFGDKPDFRQLVDKGAVIIDVRTAHEYRTGHILGATNIPLDTIASKAAELKAKNKPVITVCRSGARSGAAAGILKRAGVEAYNGGPWNSLDRVLN